VPAGNAGGLLCDTGALTDYLVESAPDHGLFRTAIDEARTRYVPDRVLAEVDYFLRDERQGMQLFMQDLARGTALVNEAYMPEPFGQTIPHYRIIEKSGGGASGVVSLVAM